MRMKKRRAKLKALQATGIETSVENKQILTPELHQKPSITGVKQPISDQSIPKTARRKRSAYFIGFTAVMIIGFAAIMLFHNFSFALDIPDGGVNGVAVLSGTIVAPADFLSHIEEMEGVYAEFYAPDDVDFSVGGIQEVVLTLTNGRRVGEAIAHLYVLAPLFYIQIEAGTPVSDVSPLYFVSMAYIVSSGTALDAIIHDGLPDSGALEVGEYAVRVSINGAFFYSQVTVADTTPPTATLVDVTIPMGQEVQPDDFIYSVFDVSPVVSAMFVNEPYVFTPYEQMVEIVFTDYFGNSAIYSATLTVLPNRTPPRILGTQDINVQLGNPIIFRRGVSAEDAFGRPLNFSVDSSGVNIRELGTYTAIYYAEDAWGLRAEVMVYVHVLEVDPDRVRELASAVLDTILHEDMTQVEEARAIFDWIAGNVAYAADVSRSSVYEGAYQAIRNRRGDCFVFFSISEVLLTLAGIPNMHIQRIEGTPNRHSWNLINPDGLGWHHFDTTPLRPVYGQRLNRFMFTSTQARHYTQIIRSYLGTFEYFTYDPILYPEIVQ